MTMASSSGSAFATAEDRLLLALLRQPVFVDTPIVSEEVLSACEAVNWEYFTEARFAIRYLYFYLKRLPSSAGVEPALMDFLEGECRTLYERNLGKLALIQKTARQCADIPATLVFLKGGAEIIRQSESWPYLATRSLADVDTLCPTEQLAKIDEDLMSRGNVFYHLVPRQNMTPEEIRQFCLESYGHYVYNVYTPDHLEVHPAAIVPKDALSFPPDFFATILQNRMAITREGITIWVPSLNDMLVYLICHASCYSDHYAICQYKDLSWDNRWTARPIESKMDKIQARMDVQQFKFLFQLRAFLETHGSRIDAWYVQRMLALVPSRPLLRMYLEFAGSILSEFEPFFPREPKTLDAIRENRLHYIQQNVTVT